MYLLLSAKQEQIMEHLHALKIQFKPDLSWGIRYYQYSHDYWTNSDMCISLHTVITNQITSLKLKDPLPLFGIWRSKRKYH